MIYPVAGIVAEYNPFHKGHELHIKKTLEATGAEAVVAVLSSNFVQRGEPALLDKWSRANAAVRCGADLVIELPVVFSSHSAGVFANAAVDILAATGIVTHISFGTETQYCLLDNIVNILLKEPPAFKILLKKNLNNGYSFVEARAIAAEELLPGSAEILLGSNNILALSYIMRIKDKNYNIIPTAIKRCGSKYNSTEIEDFSSARAVRNALYVRNYDDALSQLPDTSAKILRNALNEGRALTSFDKYWKILRAVILRSSNEQLSHIAELSEGIENKLKNEALKARTFDEWLDRCTSKRYPTGRIRRNAVNILLSLEHWENKASQRLLSPYIFPLAANKKGLALLHEIKKNVALPIASTYGKAAQISSYAEKIVSKELLAAELWEELIENGRTGYEYKRKFSIIEI